MTDPVQDSETPPWETIEAAFRNCRRAQVERAEAEQRLRQDRDSSEREAGQVFEESVGDINHIARRVKEIEVSADKVVGQFAPFRGRRFDAPEVRPDDGIPQERLSAALQDCEATASELTQATQEYRTAKAKEEQKRVLIGLLIAVLVGVVLFVVLPWIAVRWPPSGPSSGSFSAETGVTTTTLDGFHNALDSTVVVPPTVSPMPGGTATATPSGRPTATATSTSEIPTPVPVPAVAMVLIPGGEFAMGSPQSQSRQNLGEFYIDIYEVTNGDYGACVQAGVCDPPQKRSSESREHYFGNSQYERYPVIYVTWYDARTYCEWAGKRLPTGAEWEKAARGADGRTYPWGSQFDGRRLNYCDLSCRYRYRDRAFNDGYADTAAIGSYATGTSPFGVHDMAGNVSEWVADSHGSLKVVRGGSWHSAATYVRTFDWWSLGPGQVDEGVGFRCAR